MLNSISDALELCVVVPRRIPSQMRLPKSERRTFGLF